MARYEIREAKILVKTDAGFEKVDGFEFWKDGRQQSGAATRDLVEALVAKDQAANSKRGEARTWNGREDGRSGHETYRNNYNPFPGLRGFTE